MRWGKRGKYSNNETKQIIWQGLNRNTLKSTVPRSGGAFQHVRCLGCQNNNNNSLFTKTSIIIF